MLIQILKSRGPGVNKRVKKYFQDMIKEYHILITAVDIRYAAAI